MHPTDKEVYSSFAEIQDSGHNLVFDQESAASWRNSVAESTGKVDLLKAFMAKPVVAKSNHIRGRTTTTED